MKTENNLLLLPAKKDAIIEAQNKLILQLQIENKRLHEVVSLLQEQVKGLQKKFFGKQSERFVDHQLELPGMEAVAGLQEVVEEDLSNTTDIVAYKKKKAKTTPKNTITYPDDLPVEREVRDLTEEEKIDVKTGLTLVCIGEEITRRLAKKSAHFVIKEIVRKKYALPSNPDAGIKTAERPDSLLDRCPVHESFLADIVVAKYCDHLPLYRQAERLTRDDIFVSRQTLSSYVGKIGQILLPLYNMLQDEILSSGNIFIDETPVDVLAPGKGKTTQGYMTVIAGGPSLDPALRVYRFFPDRKHAHFEELLKNYKGVFHSDDYGVYEKIAKQTDVIWAPCFAHIRRHFFDAEAGDKGFRQEVLKDLQELFRIEQLAQGLLPDERIKMHREQSEPLLEALIEKNKRKLEEGSLLPKYKLTSAIKYLLRLSPYMKNYLYHPFARIDNNVSERALKHVVIGRKNWLFVGSEDGGESSAVLYSFAQTCRALKINPHEYFEDLFLRFQGHSASRLKELLPHNWKKLH